MVDKVFRKGYNRDSKRKTDTAFAEKICVFRRRLIMAKKKTSSLLGLVLMLVAIVGAALAVVGVFNDWVKYVVETVIGGGSTATTLKDLAEYSDSLEMFGAMNAFAYITMVLSVVCAVLLVLVKFLRIGILRPITGLAGLVTVLSTILMVVFTIMFCSKNAGFSLGGVASGNYTWAVGAVLATIGGVLAGVPAVLGMKK